MKKLVILFSLLSALNLDIDTTTIPPEDGTECVQPTSNIPSDEKDLN